MKNIIMRIISNSQKRYVFLKNKISNIKIKEIKKYITADLLLLYFFVGALINSTLVRYLTVKNYFDIRPILADITCILLISLFSYFIKPKGRFAYFLIWSFIITIIIFINSVYYTFYNSFVSFSLLSTSLFLVDVGDAVVQNVLEPKDIIYFWFPIMLYLANRQINHRRRQRPIHLKKSKQRAFNIFILSVITGLIFISTLTPLDFSRINKQWNREFLVARFGLYIYHLNDLIKSIEPQINTLFGYDTAAKQFREFYQELNTIEPIKNKYTNIFQGKNLITIHAESIQSFAMNLQFNGEEVTPNLNRLASQGLNFTNFYTQVGVGTSSDTEFTLNTSLLPVSNGTVFVSYWNREYVTIPSLLKEKGYYSFSMHANNGTFWNRLIMHEVMGYDKFFHKPNYTIDEKIGLGLSDASFFSQSVPMIAKLKEKGKEPFYGTMIMLTCHTPFDEIEKYGDFPVDYKTTIINEDNEEEEVIQPYMEGTRMGNYLKAVNYADRAIGQFINNLDEAGLLENTVIVIYGDHDARLPRRDFNRLYNYNPETDTLLDEEDPNFKRVDYYQYELDRKVPFIIWTKEKKLSQKVDTVMGMYDVLPTLGNMFGFRSNYQIGKDIFSIKENIVVFLNGNWLTDKVYYNSQKGEYLLLKDEPIEEDYINRNNEYADTILGVSNSLIIYDLIKRERETTELLKSIQSGE